MPEGVTVAGACADPACRAARDARLTICLLAALPLLAVALRLAGFRRIYATLGRWSSARPAGSRGGHRPPSAAARATPGHIAAVVVHVNRHLLPYQSRCLLESLALWSLLRRRGHGADLLLGARTLLGPFEAHAWVELHGAVLNDDHNVRDVYRAFELPAATAGLPDAP
jgi:hypothetical protein